LVKNRDRQDLGGPVGRPGIARLRRGFAQENPAVASPNSRKLGIPARCGASRLTGGDRSERLSARAATFYSALVPQAA
jgi:hypothetical protein